MEDYHQLIADKVSEHAAKLGRLIDYIEVGVLTGNSAIAVLGTGKCRYAMLIDDFSNTHCGDTKSSRELVEKNLKPYEELYDLRVGNSRNVLPTVSGEFDIGFVDGEHSFTACWNDMDNMLKLLREDGIMFVDDLDLPDCNINEAAERFAFEHHLNMKHHSVHNGLGELTR